MNNHRQFDHRQQLDRLVDGELSGDEYRSLLETLDEEPDGWRRCAMAFLEAQAWKQEFGELQFGSHLTCHEVPDEVSRARGRKWSTRQVVGLLLAMAASFAAAFASGTWWRIGNPSDAELDRPVTVRQASESHPTAVNDVRPREPDHDLATGRMPAEHVTFVVDHGDGKTDHFELPIYDASDSVARQLLEDSPSMPADVERAIRDSGFQVNRQRQWAPVRLHDGRRAFFPVDQLDITPVSESIYH